MKKIGYARASPAGQALEIQISKLRQYGCDELFQDEVATALGYARQGDVLVVTRLDRLADSIRGLSATVKILRQRNVGLLVLEQGLDTTTAAGEALYQALEAVAEFERSLTNERITIGMAKAKAKGVALGPRMKLTAAEIEALRQEFNTPGVNKTELAQKYGLSRASLYRLAQEKVYK
ncbi:MAG: recombinase family protein [Gammaproteobacteria bacterium]|nr:recombinase family protein [Gammaproteobacteria bacterium]MBU2004324.1 recombinase family protein [Gammaproteobacteria bacterium]